MTFLILNQQRRGWEQSPWGWFRGFPAGSVPWVRKCGCWHLAGVGLWYPLHWAPENNLNATSIICFQQLGKKFLGKAVFWKLKKIYFPHSPKYLKVSVNISPVLTESFISAGPQTWCQILSTHFGSGWVSCKICSFHQCPRPNKNWNSRGWFLTFLATIKNVVFNIKCTFIFNPEAWLSVLK